MGIGNIFRAFQPKDKIFFVLFEQVADILVEMSKEFHEGLKDFDINDETLLNKMSDYEHQMDDLTHEIFVQLGENFITPFDREDIHALISAIDDVAGNLQGASNRMRLYHVEKITKSIRKITEINLDACNLINSAVMELKELKNLNTIFVAVKKINKLESKSDYVFDKAVADIFENETDAKNVIKYKEVLSSLETATDKCKSVARVLEAIAVKHS